jgi:type VI secretion system protein ImpL
MQVLRFLISRWVLSFVGIAILAVLVWLFGPLIPSFESWVPRLAVVVGLLLVWATSNLLLDLLHRRREQKLESGVAEKTPEKADDGAGEEAAALRERMSTALALLKKARGTRGYLYEQPWYAIIGPPGAGKTTALLNSGLKFPLAAEMGQGAVAGVGGTRLCDWWFTENAVLIDTAGRYTTQDSNAAVDRAGWDSFLDLLRRTRPRQPLNGVIVAIALSDIADAPARNGRPMPRGDPRRIRSSKAAWAFAYRSPCAVHQGRSDRGFTNSSTTSTAISATRFGASPFRWSRRRPVQGNSRMSCSSWSISPQRSPVRSPAGEQSPGAS